MDDITKKWINNLGKKIVKEKTDNPIEELYNDFEIIIKKLSDIKVDIANKSTDMVSIINTIPTKDEKIKKLAITRLNDMKDKNDDLIYDVDKIIRIINKNISILLRLTN